MMNTTIIDTIPFMTSKSSTCEDGGAGGVSGGVSVTPSRGACSDGIAASARRQKVEDPGGNRIVRVCECAFENQLAETSFCQLLFQQT